MRDWFHKHSILVSSILIAFIFTVMLATSSKENKRSTNTITPTPISAKPSGPSPAEDCSKYSGEDYRLCISMQQGQQRLDEQSRPLQANVSHDGYALYITNTEAVDWKTCEIVLDDDDFQGDNYGTDGFGFNVKAGQTVTIPWGNFVNNENQRFNYYQIKPYVADMDCTVNNQIHRSNFSLL